LRLSFSGRAGRWGEFADRDGLIGWVDGEIGFRNNGIRRRLELAAFSDMPFAARIFLEPGTMPLCEPWA
jgi:hypothetical protein